MTHILAKKCFHSTILLIIGGKTLNLFISALLRYNCIEFNTGNSKSIIKLDANFNNIFFMISNVKIHTSCDLIFININTNGITFPDTRLWTIYIFAEILCNNWKKVPSESLTSDLGNISMFKLVVKIKNLLESSCSQSRRRNNSLLIIYLDVSII